MSETLDKINLYARDRLRDLLSQCTGPRQKFFVRLYPLGVDGMPQEKISRAIEQCETTIKGNNAKPLHGENNG